MVTRRTKDNCQGPLEKREALDGGRREGLRRGGGGGGGGRGLLSDWSRV
ncbi:hypothetical protein E2C01_016731 [Portunus trituberculatus]|uniref:Uncharacterized protein n=1 Tax=Portunus trituberculatus TaxID=210409 RepID=A0A5B7DPW0_PORTR|nr:hypothetical protein [Portunus trituberculatus]